MYAKRRSSPGIDRPRPVQIKTLTPEQMEYLSNGRQTQSDPQTPTPLEKYAHQRSREAEALEMSMRRARQLLER